MFGLFKRPPKPAPERKPRGVMPSYVTKDTVVLSKVAPALRNAYELRLALYMAKSKGMRFVLAVRPQAQVDPSIVALLQEHGGTVQEDHLEDYSVYVGHINAAGEEQDGWVLGDAAALNAVLATLKSSRLKDMFRVGASFSGQTLAELEGEFAQERLNMANIDGENIKDAVLALIAAAKKDGGLVFVQ